MGTPQLTAEQIAQVSIHSYKRDACCCQCVPLTPAQQEATESFFSAQLLDCVRVVILDEQRVTNPPFYSTLANMRFANLPDSGLIAAITLSHVVISHLPFTDGLLLFLIAKETQISVRRWSRTRRILGVISCEKEKPAASGSLSVTAGAHDIRM